MDLLWTGTDVLFMTKLPKKVRIRLRWRLKIQVFKWIVLILDKFFINRNYVVAEHLIDELKTVGLKRPLRLIEPPVRYPIPVKKKPHSGFNIVYYYLKGKKNQGFLRWLYGMDIIELLMDYFGDRVNWICADGSLNMEEIYPITDFVVRPNRHDGKSFMIRECILNNIPYYWSYNNPCIKDAINQITIELKKCSKKD